jgi:hypothetical protein
MLTASAREPGKDFKSTLGLRVGACSSAGAPSGRYSASEANNWAYLEKTTPDSINPFLIKVYRLLRTADKRVTLNTKGSYLKSDISFE